MIYKVCTSCEGIKPISRFNKRGGGREDYQSKCVSCNKAYQKRYFKKNKDKLHKKRKEYIESCPLRILTDVFRRRTTKAFLYRNISKGGATEGLLGANWNVIERYFEGLFKEGMSWDKPETWQIDHRKPLGRVTTVKELLKRCHYTNLQPLYPEENLFKRNKSQAQWEKTKETDKYKNLIIKLKEKYAN